MSVPPYSLRLGFLASHGGSNFQAILDAIAGGGLPADARLVISNNSASMALERGRKAGLDTLHLSNATHPDPNALDRAVLGALRERGVNLVVLAGYMKKIGPCVLAAFSRRIVNVHPALLPKYGGKGMFGMHVHEAVLSAGERLTGVTVHLVDSDYDRGPILAQAQVAVEPGDTPERLQARVLREEHRLFPETLGRIAMGKIDLDAVR